VMKDDYAKLLEFREALFPEFRADQVAAAEFIADLIHGEVHRGTINTMVDVGCGTGEILNCLKTKLQKDNHIIRCIGIDCSEGEIRQAERSNGCEFLCLAAEELLSLDHMLKQPIKWPRTLLLSVGHTVPHFENFEVFLEAVRTLQPALLLVDFYYNWDKTVKQFREGDGEQRKCEPRQITIPAYETYVLTTVKPADSTRVERGIQKIDPRIDPRVASPLVDLGFWTSQALRSSEEFEHDFVSAGYLPERSGLGYHGGYGRMSASLLSWSSRIAESMNSAYYTIVAGFVNQLFADELIRSEMGKFATKAVAVVLPFDRRKVFARYLSITTNVVAPDALMEVQGIGAGKAGLATARGLYMTLLAQVSSSMVIPFARLEDHPQLTNNDRDLDKAEQEFFAATRQGVAEAAGYFVVPVYFASLPLFCVVLSFPSWLVGKDVNRQQDVGLLADLHTKLRQEVERLFESKVLIPFIQSALPELEANGTLDSCAAIKEIREAISCNQERPWKSWLLTIPSIPIRELRNVQGQQNQLDEMLRRAEESALSDVMVRIANWFRDGRFFEWDGRNTDPHEKCTDVHLGRLSRMLADIKCGTVDEIEMCWHFGHPRSIGRELQWLAAQLREIAQKKPGEESGGATNAFRNLKSVFNRVPQGREWRFRFSSRRIATLCAMYIPDKPITDYCEEPNEDVPTMDPVPILAGIALQLGQHFLGFIEGITLSSKDEEVEWPYLTRSYVLRFALTQSLGLWTVGTASQALVKALCTADPVLDWQDKSVRGIELSFRTKVTRVRSKDEKGREKIRWTKTTILPANGQSHIKVVLT